MPPKPAETTAADRSEPSAIRRFAPVAALAAAMGLVFAMGWHRHLSLESIAAHRDGLKALIAAHWLPAYLGYILIYAGAVAVSLPGALFLTLTGGLLFGWLLGGIAAVSGATLGAIGIFFVARSAFGETLASKAGPWLVKLRDGFKEDAFNYLLFLRLVPVFPFWLVNLAPALLGVPLSTFAIGTFLGIIPGTLAYASAGASLDSVIVNAKAEFDACVAAKGAANCKLGISLSSLVSKELVIAGALLGVAALIPIGLKKWRARHAARA
jgi:uncharacterized membrane protein YdjX (TVP38/TMEM64 family)